MSVCTKTSASHWFLSQWYIVLHRGWCQPITPAQIIPEQPDQNCHFDKSVLQGQWQILLSLYLVTILWGFNCVTNSTNLQTQNTSNKSRHIDMMHSFKAKYKAFNTVKVQSRSDSWSILGSFKVILFYFNSNSEGLDQELMLFSLCHHPPTTKLF